MQGRTAPVQEVPLQGKPTGCSLMAVRLWLTAKAIVAWPVHLPVHTWHTAPAHTYLSAQSCAATMQPTECQVAHVV